MPRAHAGLIRAALSAALAASSLAAPTLGWSQVSTGQTQSPYPTPNRPDTETKKQTNPILDSQPKPALPGPATPEKLPDYRKEFDPRSQRLRQAEEERLPIFGTSFFESAREMIRNRKAYLARTANAGLLEARRQPAGGRQPSAAYRMPGTGTAPAYLAYPPTAEELALIANLTDAQKTEIRTRHQAGQLTREEERRYRFILYPWLAQVVSPPTQQELDAVAALTPAQKLDLLQRQRDGLLTDLERRKYRALFLRQSPTPEERSALQPEPLPYDRAINELTDREKLDLFERQRDGRLTEEEKRKYRALLEPADQSSVVGSQSSVDRQQEPETDRSNRQSSVISRPSRDSGRQGEGVGARTGRSGRDLQPDVPEDLTGLAQLPDAGTQPVQSVDQSPYYQSPYERPVDTYRDTQDPLAIWLQHVIAPPSQNYQIGGGDKLTLLVGSPTMPTRQQEIVVESSGMAYVPGIGPVALRGKTLAQAEQALRERLSHLYRDARVSLSLPEARPISITMSGDSYYPGPFQVPSTVTAINMILATGGPTDAGSMREIQVLRNGRRVGTIDLYRFLITGSWAGDVQLQDGDTIYVPGHHARVELCGEVRRPATYEILDAETLDDAIRYAGGTNPTGVSQHVQVATVQPGIARVLRDVDITSLEGSHVPVYDGDRVDVFSLRQDVANKVTIEGAVDQPSEYALAPGMTVRDLVMTARGPVSDYFPGVAHLNRMNADGTLTLIPVNLEKALAGDAKENVTLQRWDRLTVYTREEVAWTGRREVSIVGAVQRHGLYPFSDNMRVKDALLMAGGPKPDAYTNEIRILHQHGDGTYAYQFVNLARVLRDDPTQNIVLQDRDIVAVYTEEEAHYTPEHTIRVEGEVVSPGKYKRGENMRLSEALKLAGWFTPSAGDRVQVAHARTQEGAAPSSYTVVNGTLNEDPMLQDGDVIAIQGRGNFQEHPIVVTVTGAVHNTGAIVLPGPNARLTDAIRMAGGLKPEAFPEGVEFHRDPRYLETAGQRQITVIVKRLNDWFNEQDRNQKVAASQLDRAKALGKVGGQNSSIAIPGITPVQDNSAATAAAISQAAPALFNQNLVAEPRDLTAQDFEPSGNVAIDLPAALKKPGSDEDILLTDGDTIQVPERPTTVTVVGAVVRQAAVRYRPGMRLEDYVTEAGGPAPDAALDRAIVVRLGGGTLPAKKVKQFQPGDMIVVPNKVLAERVSNRNSDLDTAIKSVTGATLLFFVAKKIFGF